jgi:hypothetical protein
MKSKAIWHKSAAVAATVALATATVFSLSAVSFAVQPDQNVPAAVPDKPSHAVCSRAQGPDAAHCQAHVVDDGKGKPLATTSPTGYGPLQLRTGYSLPATAASKQIIAIVDAFNDPTAKADLDHYSSQFGLPVLPDCVGAVSASATPCFQKVDQRGGTAYPTTDSGWALEISLDVQVAHAICPNCSLLLVESDSNSFANLLAAEDRAVGMGANEVSNSWGGGEFSSEASFDSHFSQLGVAFTVSSGDSGYGAEYPSSSRFVTSVGGTTLNLNPDNSYNNESAWSGGGSGCSNYETKPGFQSTISGCSRRITADVSADANPSTGASVYDTTPYSGQSGWFQVGGTSLSSPLIAAVYALAGGVPSGVQGNTIPYSHATSGGLHDVITGKNGRCNRTPILCNAGPGYDGPTGLGTPLGVGAF